MADCQLVATDLVVTQLLSKHPQQLFHVRNQVTKSAITLGLPSEVARGTYPKYILPANKQTNPRYQSFVTLSYTVTVAHPDVWDLNTQVLEVSPLTRKFHIIPHRFPFRL